MQIHSVTEHINNLNSEIDKHVEFINNVKRMRKLQVDYNNHAASDFDYRNDLRAIENTVDDFLSKGVK